MTRSFVSSLVFGIGAALLWASAAAAGGVILPWGSTVCAGTFAAENNIIGADMFVGFVRCADLCKATASDCVKFTRDAYACQNGLISDDLDYSKKECENAADPPTRKSCQLIAKTTADAARVSLKSDRDEALGFCATWRSDCLGHCSGT
jgi:hypothetical protein